MRGPNGSDVKREARGNTSYPFSDSVVVLRKSSISHPYTLYFLSKSSHTSEFGSHSWLLSSLLMTSVLYSLRTNGTFRTYFRGQKIQCKKDLQAILVIIEARFFSRVPCNSSLLRPNFRRRLSHFLLYFSSRSLSSSIRAVGDVSSIELGSKRCLAATDKDYWWREREDVGVELRKLGEQNWGES